MIKSFNLDSETLEFMKKIKLNIIKNTDLSLSDINDSQVVRIAIKLCYEEMTNNEENEN